MDGFFVAKFKKLADGDPSTSNRDETERSSDDGMCVEEDEADDEDEEEDHEDDDVIAEENVVATRRTRHQVRRGNVEGSKLAEEPSTSKKPRGAASAMIDSERLRGTSSRVKSSRAHKDAEDGQAVVGVGDEGQRLARSGKAVQKGHKEKQAKRR
jgi:hypothetical protein